MDKKNDFEKKRVIEVYKMTNSSYLFGRSKNCKPYILTSMSNKVILLEVPKDYIKTNEAEYYFLSSDLTEKENQKKLCRKKHLKN